MHRLACKHVLRTSCFFIAIDWACAPGRFEIALWTACGRLPTWKDKEDSQAAPRGGLKRAETGVSDVGSSSKDLAYTSSSGVEEGNMPSFESGIAEDVRTVKEEEQELRDALFGVSPPEVSARLSDGKTLHPLHAHTRK